MFDTQNNEQERAFSSFTRAVPRQAFQEKIIKLIICAPMALVP